MPASTSQRRTKPKVRRNSDVINDSRRHSRNPCKTHERMDEPAEIVAMRSQRADHRPACTGCRRPHRSGHWGIKHYDGMGEQGIRLRQYLRINVSGQPAWPAHPRMESGFQGTQNANVHNLVAVVYFGVEHLRDVNEHYGRRIANTVLYQPIFNVNTKRIVSLDTIVRVHDKKGAR